MRAFPLLFQQNKYIRARLKLELLKMFSLKKMRNTSNSEYIIARSYFTSVAQQTYVEFNSSAQRKGSISNGKNKNY